VSQEGNKTMKNTLKAKTPHGTFTRLTNNSYTHVVVRSSERAKKAVGSNEKFGAEARWAKDNGFIVSWHSGKTNAEKAASKIDAWDRDAVVLGIYKVLHEILLASTGMDFSEAVSRVAMALEMPQNQAERLLNNMSEHKTLVDYSELVKVLTK